LEGEKKKRGTVNSSNGNGKGKRKNSYSRCRPRGEGEETWVPFKKKNTGKRGSVPREVKEKKMIAPGRRAVGYFSRGKGEGGGHACKSLR